MNWRYDFSGLQATAVFCDSEPPAPSRSVWPVGFSDSSALVGAVVGPSEGVRALVRPYQYHSAEVAVVTAAGLSGSERADALVSLEPDLALCILTADCVPIVFATDSAVAIAHCGWRGLVGGIIMQTVSRLRLLSGDDGVSAVVGPHICGDCYEFEGDSAAGVRAAVGDVAFKSVNGKQHLDLDRLIALEFEDSKVSLVGSVEQCTFESQRFSSFRRDGSDSRQVSFVWRGAAKQMTE